MSEKSSQKPVLTPSRTTEAHASQRLTRQDFVWPAGVLILSVTVSLICWLLYNTLPQMANAGGKHLRLALVSPKFNGNGEQAPRVHIPELLPEPQRDWSPVAVTVRTEQPPLLPPTIRHEATRQLPAEPFGLPYGDLPLVLGTQPPPPPWPEAMPEEIRPARLTALDFPPVVVQAAARGPLIYRDLPSGDTPMLRNWKTLALYSLLTTTVVVAKTAPAVADDQVILERIASLQKTINDSTDLMKGEIKSLNEKFDAQHKAIDKIKNNATDLGLSLNKRIEDIERALVLIRDDLNNRKPDSFTDKSALDKTGIDDIRAKLGNIEQAILKLQPPSNRVSLSPPVAASGRVVLVNLFSEDVLFVVNQVPYRVAPGSNRPIENVIAGNLNYELIAQPWGQVGRNTTRLAANETLTLTAR